MIVGSGNVVHNLGRIAWAGPMGGFAWNRRFDDAATALMRGAPGDILKLVDHDDFARAVPTPDHFIPLLYIAALAAEDDETRRVLVDGYAYGSLSMTCYTLGAECPEATGDSSAAELPAPAAVPTEQANI